MTHAELLERYFEARQSVINEWSHSIARDMRRLYQEVNEYAEENGIDFFVSIPSWYEE